MSFTEEEFTNLQNRVQQMQEYIIANEKMISLGSLVAGVTHEISTPIGLGVTGMSHFISETNRLRKLFDKQEMTEEDFKNYLKSAEKTADIVYSNLFNAKNTIQSFKRVSVDQSNELKREFDLHEYINQIINSLHNRIKHTKIKVVNQVDESIAINSYAGSFAQIFTNLIMNSLIHGFNDGDSGTIKIIATQDDRYTYIKYSDDGAGISSANLEKVYEPFFTTKANDGGSGLGLQIIHKLVTEQLQGEIFLESQEGEGVLFSFTLPKELS